jgi:hypothetical protein
MVKSNKYNLIAIVSLMLTIANYNMVFAQKNTKYTRIGLNLSSDYLQTSNEFNNINYNFRNVLTYNFGLSFKVFENNNYRISSIFSIRNYSRVNEVSIKGEDLGFPDIDFKAVEELSPFTQYKLSTNLDCFLINKHNLNLFFSIGPELILYPNDPITSIYYYRFEDDKQIGYNEIGNSKNSELYFGINFSIGIDIKTKNLLISPYVLYHYEPGNLFESIITTENLMVSENTISRHTIKNSYISIGINLHPNKLIFKKKKTI